MTPLRQQMIRGLFLVFAALFLIAPGVGHAEPFDHEHSAWSLLLKNNVRWNLDRTASQVNYANFQSNRDFLGQYLDKLTAVSRVEFDSFNRDQQLAFLINAYNAFTVELILTEYPDVTSIKELGSFFSSPWKKKSIRSGTRSSRKRILKLKKKANN